MKKAQTFLWSLLISSFLIISPKYIHADSWGLTGVISSTSLVNADCIPCFNPVTGDFLAVWTDSSNNYYPTYSIYHAGTWSSPLTISTTSTANSNVYISSDSSGNIMATWSDGNNDSHPTYSFYNGTTWSPASTISNTLVTLSNVFVSCNTSLGTFLATWAENTDSEHPYYSIYSGGVWSTPAQISGTSDVSNIVFTAFDSISSTFMASWVDTNNSDLPTYSVFNGSSWSTPSVISNTLPVSGGGSYVALSVDSSTGDFMGTWIDNGSSYPYYSIYNGSSWSTPSPITATNIGPATSVLTSFNSYTGQFMAAWGTFSSFPMYSIYTDGVWSAPSTISTISNLYNSVYLAYDPLIDQFLATWADDTSSYPTYSIYTGPIPIRINPPSNLVGFSTVSKFLTQKEVLNILRWNPPIQGTTPVSYRIYSDIGLTDLIGTVAATSKPSFTDHNRRAHTVYTYYVVSVDGSGNQSAPATITIMSK